jgi:hypothetical protein
LRGRIPSPSDRGEFHRVYQAQVVRPTLAACEKFRAIGVTVRRRALPSEIAQLARTKRVLILWTHWGQLSFRRDEIKNPEEAVQLALQGDHWVHSEVRRAFQAGKWTIWKSDPRRAVDRARRHGDLKRFLADSLNAAVANTEKVRDTARDREFLLDRSDTPTAQSMHDKPATTRVLIEQHFGDTIEPGRPLELSDGMHTVWELSCLLPDDRWLILDFTVCKSTEIAEVLRSTRPRIRVIGHYHETDMATGALLVDRTLEQLIARSRGYLDARALAVRQLGDELWRGI